MKTIYIQFNQPKIKNQISPDRLLKKLFKKVVIAILTTLIPKANPDYEVEISNVKTWLVEIEEETGIPGREIGLDADGNPILKMPHKNNYGFWIDNNLLLEDFMSLFKAQKIDKAIFDTNWGLLH